MIRITMGLFIILTLSLSSFLEVSEKTHADEHETHSIQRDLIANQNTIGDLNCPDCHDDGCESEGDCCLNLCSCPASFYMKSIKNQLSSQQVSKGKMHLYFLKKYRSPCLDPAIKPPLFS